MPQMDSMTCACCHLPRRVRVGASLPFTCESCRGHVGASVDSQARREQVHAGWYWAMWQGAENRLGRLRDSLERAGYKIERLEAQLAELRGDDPDNEAEKVTMVDRLRTLHHVVLQTGRCSCGKDAKCPTLRVVETA